MLFKLSVSNIRRSLRDYAIYFFTLMIGVAVFYVFNAVSGQVAMTRVDSDTREIARILRIAISSTSVFVAGVLGLLIVYASRFLMKRRNNEFALYLMLGMSKGKISAILLLETVIIGIGSLAAGLLLGICLSQVMSALVVSLFEADMTAYHFMISGSAIARTMICFAVMYLVVMLLSSAVVSRFKLIDLMQSGKRSEQIKLRSPWLCVAVFLLGAAILGTAYYMVGWRFTHLTGNGFVLCIAAGILSTFLIFWSVSGMILRVVMSMKRTYFRSLNSFTFRQLSSKVNTMVFSMSVICIMLFVTICALSAAFSLRNSMNANLREHCPADFELSEYLDEPLPELDVLAEAQARGLDPTDYSDNWLHIAAYGDEELTFESFCGEHFEELRESFTSINGGFYEQIVGVDDYNALMELYGREPVELGDDEYVLMCDFTAIEKVRSEVLEDGGRISVFGRELSPKYRKCQPGFIELSAQSINGGIFVVPQALVEGAAPMADYVIGNYSATDEDEIRAVDEELRSFYADHIRGDLSGFSVKKNGGSLGFTTKLEISSGAIGIGAIATFLGLYIGLVFLIACGAILALKELSESVDSIGRYEMIRKIGAEESDISRSLFRQTGIFFLLPLLLAIVHSVVGMKFAMYFLTVFGTERIGSSVALTSVILLLIYGGYFLVTYFCSRNIIRTKR
ncbi:MAG: ABC transporter permease, partial [Ruminococcus sp.]|nr:ABC transporter permease [Ruminococcus sp.]